MKSGKILGFFGISLFVAIGAAQANEKLDAKFSVINEKILIPKCATCHTGAGASRTGIDLASYAAIMRQDKLVVPAHADDSVLYKAVKSGAMPAGRGAQPLSDEEVTAIKTWIDLGAQNN